MAIRKVGVLGAGLMGSGIAEVCAKSGYDTVVREVDESLVKKGLSRIEGSLGKAVEKGKLAAGDRDAAWKRLSSTTRLEDLAGLRPVIEAIVENLDVKKETFGALDGICGPERDLLLQHLLADDHRALRRDAASRPLRRAAFLQPRAGHEARRGRADDRDLGGDRRRRSSSSRSRWARSRSARGDNSGFVVNRLLVPYLLDAVRALEEGVGSREDIDKGMELGCGHPMGPLKLLDFVGLDTTYASPRSCTTSTARSVSLRRRS